MSSKESSKLVEAFENLLTATSFKQKSDVLTQAKHFIFNQMKDEDIKEFFVNNPSNFENLFNLDIWVKNLEESGGIVDYPEAYDIIRKIFQTFSSLNDLVKSFYDQIVFILNQNVDEKVKHVCVDFFIELTRKLDFSNVQSQFLAKDQFELRLKRLLVLFVEQIPNTTASYTTHLTDFLCFLTIRLDKIEAKHQEDQKKVHVFSCSVFDDNLELLKAFENVTNMNSVQAFRVMEMFIRLATVSNNHLASISEEKYSLSQRINHYLNDTSDVLSQLNCIELIGDLIVPAHGFYFMQKTGHLNRLINYLKFSSDPNAAILIPSIVKLFGQITKERPQECKEHFPIFYEYLFRKAQDENIVRNNENIIFAIETFCYIFENNLVKKFVVENYREDFLSLLHRLLWMIRNCINDKLKTNALRCLCELFCPDCSLLDCNESDIKFKNSHWVTSEWINLSKEIYEIVTTIFSHENLFNLCLSFAKEPFAENRKSAHLYFKALGQSDWGLRLLFTPNKYNCEEVFLDGYLLNRSIELDKASMESKLEMIKIIVSSFELNPILINIIGNVAYEKLKHYVNEGAFWTRGESQVAFESV